MTPLVLPPERGCDVRVDDVFRDGNKGEIFRVIAANEHGIRIKNIKTGEEYGLLRIGAAHSGSPPKTPTSISGKRKPRLADMAQELPF